MQGTQVQPLIRELRSHISGQLSQCTITTEPMHYSNPPPHTHMLFSHLSCVRLFANPWTAACQASLSFTISQSLLKLMSIESAMPSNHLILCCPLLLLPSIFSNIRVSSNESAVHWNTPWLSLCYKPLTVAWAEKIQTYPRSLQSAGPEEWTGWGMSRRYSFLCSSLLLLLPLQADDLSLQCTWQVKGGPL